MSKMFRFKINEMMCVTELQQPIVIIENHESLQSKIVITFTVKSQLQFTREMAL